MFRCSHIKRRKHNYFFKCPNRRCLIREGYPHWHYLGAVADRERHICQETR